MSESTSITIREYWKTVAAPALVLILGLFGGTGGVLFEAAAGSELPIAPWVVWLASLVITAGAGVWGWYRIARTASALSRQLHDERLPKDQRDRVRRLKQIAGQALAEVRRGGAINRERVDSLLEEIKADAGALAEYGGPANLALAYRVVVLTFCRFVIEGSLSDDQQNDLRDTCEAMFEMLVAGCNGLLLEFSTSHPDKAS